MFGSTTAHTLQPRDLSNLASYQLRSLVLDYMSHQSYSNTARAFLRDSTVKHFDADGDELVLPLSSSIDTALSSEAFEKDLNEADLRAEVIGYILSGRIDDATELLDEHFPRVLCPDIRMELGADGLFKSKPDHRTEIGAGSSHTTKRDYVAPHSLEPEHLSLNLRIQSFIEACRTTPLPYEKVTGRKHGGLGDAPCSSEDQRRKQSPLPPCQGLHRDEGQQMILLSKAQKLYALVNMISDPSDRKQYHEELKNIAGLLAYTVPEKSLLSKYLSQERREAVAEQVKSAILKSCNRPVLSTLELVTRHVTVAWGYANEHGATAQPGAVVPPVKGLAVKGAEKETEVVPVFELDTFLNAKLYCHQR